MSTLRFEGSKDFRGRLVCCVLSGRPFRIDGIRSSEASPGIHEHEASLLRLVEKISNGTRIEISTTGTTLRVKPGVLSGGVVKHDCASSKRGMGYFLEVLAALAPFSKAPLLVTLTGYTNTDDDLSVDVLRTVTLRTLAGLIGTSDGLELKIVKRGCLPNGGGEVVFKCPVIKQAVPIQWTDPGKVKRIRGLAWTTRCSPQLGSRCIDTAKGVLLPFSPNVYVYADHFKGSESGQSPGFGICLVAETTTGALISCETQGSGSESKEVRDPEFCGKMCGLGLLNELQRGSCCDESHQWLVFLYMALASEDVSNVRVSKVSSYAARWLRLINKVFGIRFKISEDSGDGSVLLSCIGSGFINFARQTK
eukprot:ANDGO_05523.mRNA.1 putative RNA 3'-terminal phosphate cyclase-like protein